MVPSDGAVSQFATRAWNVQFMTPTGTGFCMVHYRRATQLTGNLQTLKIYSVLEGRSSIGSPVDRARWHCMHTLRLAAKQTAGVFAHTLLGGMLEPRWQRITEDRLVGSKGVKHEVQDCTAQHSPAVGIPPRNLAACYCTLTVASPVISNPPRSQATAGKPTTAMGCEPLG